MKSHIICFFIILAAYATRAQTNTYYTELLTEKQGLSSNKITCILQDRTGFLWVGTRHGLNRYDGARFKIFLHNNSDSLSICGNEICEMAEDQNGLLWIATWSGLSCYNPKNGQFTNYLNEPGNRNSLPTNNIIFVHVDKHNQVWVSSTNFGLSLYNRENKKFTTYALYPSKNKIPTARENSMNRLLLVSEDKAGNLWLVPHTDQGFTYKFNTITHHVERIDIPKMSPLYNDNIQSSIFAEDEENIWVGSWGGLKHFNYKTKEWKNYIPEKTTLQNVPNLIYYIAKKDPSHLIIHSGRGYGIFNTINHKFNFSDTTYNKEWNEHILEGVTRSGLYTDRQGIEWQIRLEGLAKIDPLSRKFKSIKLPLSGTMDLVYKDTAEHIVLISSFFRNIYFTIYDERNDSFTIIKSLPGWHFSSCIPLGNKKYLLGGYSGELIIFNLKDNSFTQFFTKRYDPKWRSVNLTKIIFDKKGNLWAILLNGGICKIDTSKAIVELFIHDEKNINSIRENSVSDIFEDREGRIWIMYEMHGVTIFNPYTLQMIHYENTAKTPDILPSNFIGNMVCDIYNNYWLMSCDEGLCKYNNPNSKYPFTIIKNLPGDKFTTAEADKNGHLWIGSNNGILDYDIKSGKTKCYKMQDGLPQNEIDNHIYKTSDGEIFVPFQKELIHFYPGHIISNPYAPKPVITSFKIFDTEQPLQYNSSGSIEYILPYDQNFISFEFAGLNFSNPQGNSFAYILEGVDHDWVYCGNRQFASYTNLKGGEYTFKVKSANSDGVWSKEIAEFKLTIIPPFWETWWFKISILFVIILGIYIYIKYRTGLIKQRESVRSRMIELESKALRSQMNPHFIFNSLNSIQNYILNNDRLNSAKYLTKFSRLIRLILENSQHQSISLDDEIKALELYIQLEQYRFKDKFVYNIDIEPTIHKNDIHVPPLIMQPYIENAIWHGFMHKEGKGELKIEIKEEAGCILCIIEDDGIGRKKSISYKKPDKEKHNSTGMRVTRDRLELLNENKIHKVLISITDLDNPTGTRVEIKIPLVAE